MRILAVMMVALVPLLSAFAGDKYPLTMTAVFTEGKSQDSSVRRTFQSGDGDYFCTSGDEHGGPVCRMALEWSRLDSSGGTPDVVVFTLEDGSRVGVQTQTATKIANFIECSPATSVIFCSLYFEMAEATIVKLEKPAKYGQTVLLSPEEYTAAVKAKHRQLFGDQNVMTVHFRYKLKGKLEKDGFQRIEIEPATCPTCKIVHSFNSRGDGYYKR